MQGIFYYRNVLILGIANLYSLKPEKNTIRYNQQLVLLSTNPKLSVYSVPLSKIFILQHI